MPGEAFQFDWSEDWAIIAGERTKLQVAQFKLCYCREFFLRAYPQQTHEMLLDAQNWRSSASSRICRCASRDVSDIGYLSLQLLVARQRD